MPRRVAFRVSFVLPDGATIADARAYTEDAVATMKGCLMPYGVDPEDPNVGDPMADLDGDTVRVTKLRKRRNK